ncbi:MAG: recombinase family protein [Spirochaetales bacterium]|nr:recombinase family protein [Spirochaetales bacterium]
MDFLTALKSAAAKGKRRSGVKAYYSGGQVHFSRLFGYMRVGDRYEPDPKYKEAIRIIFERLADGKSLPEIKAELDSMKARDSSGNKFAHSRILGIAERSVYAGFLQQGIRLRKVENLMPIVPLELWKKAQKQVRLEKKRMLAS